MNLSRIDDSTDHRCDYISLITGTIDYTKSHRSYRSAAHQPAPLIPPRVTDSPTFRERPETSASSKPPPFLNMSRWLQNAANFLEKLDDTAGKVIVESKYGNDDDAPFDDDPSQLDSILAARGLGDSSLQELDDSIHHDGESENAWTEHGEEDLDLSVPNVLGSDVTTDVSEPKVPESVEPTPVKGPPVETEPAAPYPDTPFVTPRQRSTDSLVGQDHDDGGDHDSAGAHQRRNDPEATAVPVSAAATRPTVIAPPPPQPTAYEVPQQLRLAQKEARTLKRHIVALNQQLEASEREVAAQREELESVAVLMEKERAKFKVDKETLSEMHQAKLNAMKQKHDEHTNKLLEQIKTLNEQRAQEGGNWTKELEDALEREQETLRKVALLEDERDTLQQHIDTLEQQQQALGIRLESLTETADTASERERQAEQRLDELLTAHAKQIQQRQLREAELERTVSELGAALVKAREAAGPDGTSANPAALPDTMPIESLRSEIETLQAQLFQEQQRNNILKEEIKTLSSEHCDEASVLQLRKEHHERQIQQLNETILQLKKELRDNESRLARQAGGDSDMAKQVRSLSDELIRLREKMSSTSSETSALKSRLQVALDRAKRAERALEEKSSANIDLHGLEMGHAPNRNRGGGLKGHPTMRSVLKLDFVQGEGSERLAKSLDSLDAFLVQSGRFLRHNALARLIFILYFTMMHLWTFLLLFFHVHGYDSMRAESMATGHGPAGIMAQHVAQVAAQPIPGN